MGIFVKVRHLPIIILASFIFQLMPALAQEVTVVVKWEGAAVSFTNFTVPESNRMDTLEVWQEANQQVNEWQAEGYLQASYSIQSTPDTLFVTFQPGRQWKWVLLRAGNIPEEILRTIGWRSFRPEDDPLRPATVQAFLQRVVRYGENHGHPFAAAFLDSVEADEWGQCKAALSVDWGPFIVMDTLQMVGDVGVSQSFMQALIGIREGDPYNESLLVQMASRINETTFLRTAKPPEVVFVREKALIRLYLEPVKASTFNFLIGILPNSDQQGGRLLVNGEATLRLANPFGSGRNILLDWKNLQPRSPQIRASIDWPFVAGSSVGVDGQFHLFKRDTFFVDIEGTAGLRYALAKGGYLRAFLTSRSSNLIYVDTIAIRQSGALPERLDVRNSLLGIQYFINQLDYRFNPRKGWQLSLTVSGGRRAIKPNATILALSDAKFDFQQLYDSVNASAFTGRVEVWLDKFWPIARRSTMLTGVRSGWMYAGTLWTNELFRIGGNHLLRGFDEESILVSSYQIMTMEYRYLLSRNAWFALFGDVGYVRNDAEVALQRAFWPAGLGAGLALETGAGVFEVSYALGRLNADNPFQLRKARVHLGFVSYF